MPISGEEGPHIRITARARRRATLTRERVLAVALETANEESLDGLTIRSLAERLGVTPMALYRYVSGKDDLLNGVLDLVIGQAHVTDHGKTRWKDWLRETFLGMRDALVAHPGVIPLLGSASVYRPGALAVMEEVLSTLKGAGFSDAAAARGLTVLVSYTVGSVAIERPTRSLVPGADNDTEWLRQVRVRFEALPGPQFPVIVGLAAHLARSLTRAEFKIGLDQIIGALHRK